MNKFGKNKKFGFTLGEIAIAVLIIGILIVLLMPIVTRQLQKTDEYSYYMAYKTIDKIAGQIVALPEQIENEESTGYTPMINKRVAMAFPKRSEYAPRYTTIFDTLRENLAQAHSTIFSILNPPAYAASQSITYEIEIFDEAAYDEANNYVRTCIQGYCDNFDIINSNSNYKKYCPDKYIEKDCHQTTENGEPVTKCDTVYWASDKETDATGALRWNRSDFNDCISDGSYYMTDENGNKTKDLVQPYENIDPLLWSSIDEITPPTTFTDSMYSSFFVTEENEETGEGSESNSNYEKAKKLLLGTKGKEVMGTLQNAKNYNSRKYKKQAEIAESPYIADRGDTYDFPKALCNGIIKQRVECDNSSSNNNNKCSERFIDATKITVGWVDPTKEDGERISGYCKATIIKNITGLKFEPPQEYTQDFSVSACTKGQGFYQMENKGEMGRVDCKCQMVNSIQTKMSINNVKACCKPPTEAETLDGKVAYYSSVTGSCINCKYGAFNETTGACCANGQYYNAEMKQCVNLALKDNTQAYYLVSGKEFCQKIADTWNTKPFEVNGVKKDYNCDTFGTNTPGYYSDLYNAVYDTSSSTLNSIKKFKTTSFKNIAPNIIFANGLKMWILGDRFASIPGLTYSPKEAAADQNMCVLNIDQKKQENCTGNKHFYCGAEHACYQFKNGQSTNLTDARNCCLSVDSSDADGADKVAISGFTVYVDINGDKKGTSTLWDDIYPFYITTTGVVYPAYPLDASKEPPVVTKTGKNTEVKTSIYMGGNNPANLTTDVYYYDQNDLGFRTRKMVVKGVSYAWASCIAGHTRLMTPYCLNLFPPKSDGTRDDEKGIANYMGQCSSQGHKCYISIRRKTRIF